MHHRGAQFLLIDEIENERADEQDELADGGRQDREDGRDDAARLLLHLERWLADAACTYGVERFLQLLQQRKRLRHRLQLLLDEGPDLAGASQPIGDRRREQHQQAGEQGHQQHCDHQHREDARHAARAEPTDQRQHDGGNGPGEQDRHDDRLSGIGAPQQRDDKQADGRHLAGARPGVEGEHGAAVAARSCAGLAPPWGLALGLPGLGRQRAVFFRRRLLDLGHGVEPRERKVPLTTRPALTACDQTVPQAEALLMSPSVRSSRARCASGISAMIFAHTASTL